MKIDVKNINLWSKMGSRATFGMCLLEIQKEFENLQIVTSDVSTSAGLDRFKKNYPEKYTDVGISEQNLIGVATGLSEVGFNVLTTTFSPFQILRCCEQIKNNLGYMKSKITMVGLASGLVLGTLGFTHASIEDVGVIRSIPNINIISPADSLETVKSVYASLKQNQSTYIRLTGGQPSPKVYNEDYNFQIGKAIKLREGEEVAILACGARVKDAMEASDQIYKDIKRKISVYNFHSIKPIDEKEILLISKKYKYIITVEEHNIIGGLGSAVAETLCSSPNTNSKLIRLGIKDSYPPGGEYNYLINLLNLDVKSLYKLSVELLEN
jgi:transketolase